MPLPGALHREHDMPITFRRDGGPKLTVGDDELASCRAVDLRKAPLSATNLAGLIFNRVRFDEADLSYTVLEDCRFVDCEFDRARLVEACFERCDLLRTSFVSANMSRVRLLDSVFASCNMRQADLVKAEVRRSTFKNIALTQADLRDAKLSGSTFVDVDMRRANLAGVDLEGTTLKGVNLSGAVGLLDPVEWMEQNFKQDDKGYLVFKRLGWDNYYPMPPEWVLEPGSVITEQVNPNPTEPCGCGVNFGTKAWCLDNCVASRLWLCRVPWKALASLTVPYNTDGKARVGRLELLHNLGTVDPLTGFAVKVAAWDESREPPPAY